MVNSRLKFRAKAKKVWTNNNNIPDGEWVYGYHLKEAFNNELFGSDFVYQDCIRMDFIDAYIDIEVDINTLGQCVGNSKDKNGKLIFSGDILKSKTKDMDCIVKYDDVNCAFNINKVFIENNQAEVTGNIYENGGGKYVG